MSSDSAQQQMQWLPINDGVLLPKPEDTTPLEARILGLSRNRLATIPERVELAAIYVWVTRGSITAGQVWSLLLDFYDYSQSASSTEDGEWLVPVHEDQNAVWRNLEQLAGGERIPPYPAREEQDAAVTRWVKDVMHMLGGTDASEYDIAKYLPREVCHHVRHEAAREWLGSPLVIGASLEALPSKACGGFGMYDEGVWVADAFTRAAVSAIDEARAATGDDVKPANGRVKLWWMLLKGFTYSMLSTDMDRSLPAMLVRHPDIAIRLVRALQEGLEHIKEVPRDQTLPAWGNMNTELAERIGNTDTLDLIAKFRKRLVSEAESMEALSNTP